MEEKQKITVSIEEIGGRKVSVIRKPFDAEWVREQLSMGAAVKCDCSVLSEGVFSNLIVGEAPNGTFYQLGEEEPFFEIFPIEERCFMSTITILPPLPKHPTPDDASLLYRYMSEGLQVHADIGNVKLNEPLLGFDNSSIGEWIFGHGFYGHRHYKLEITHAVNAQGKRVEVAIMDKEG
jgi:hypothetical protein